MNRGRSSCTRTALPALLAMLVCGAATGTQAQEAKADNASAAAAVSSAAKPEGISSAQKDFEAHKSATRDAALQSKSGLPGVNLPEWHGTMPSSTPVPSDAARLKTPTRDAKKKSENWLVDAMEKRSTESGRDRDRDPTLARDDEAELEANAKREDEGRAERNKRDEPDRKTTAAAAVNPLNQFLGDWMTPQDYALLKPVLTQPSTSGPDARSVAPFAGLPGGLAEPTNVGNEIASGLIGATPTKPAFTPPPRENPYLQSLALPESMAAATRVPTLPAARPAPIASPPPMIAPAQISPPPTKIPDFAKPQSDDKYFKPLKRF